METLIEELEQFLDKNVRPALAAHHGNVAIHSLNGDTLKVTLRGQCAGCPSAHSTNEELISQPVMEAFPAIHQVVLVEETSEEDRKSVV